MGSKYQGCGVDEFPGDSDSDSDSDPPESTPTPNPTPESAPALYVLTAVGEVILVIFLDTRWEGAGTNPGAISLLIELEIRKKKTSVLLVTRQSDWCINLRSTRDR